MSVYQSFLQPVGFIRSESSSLPCLGNRSTCSALALCRKQDEGLTIKYVVYRLHLSLLFSVTPILCQIWYHSIRRLSGFIFPEIKHSVASWVGDHTGHERDSEGLTPVLFPEVTTTSSSWALLGFPLAFDRFHSELSCCSINSATTHPSAFCLPTFCC